MRYDDDDDDEDNNKRTLSGPLTDQSTATPNVRLLEQVLESIQGIMALKKSDGEWAISAKGSKQSAGLAGTCGVYDASASGEGMSKP